MTAPEAYLRNGPRRFVPDSALEGFEPSVPHRIGPFGRSRTGLEPDEGRRLKTEIRSPGTDNSNPALSTSESVANLTHQTARRRLS